MRYAPEVFSTATLAEAKAIILTEEDTSTERRWEKETPYLIDLIIEHGNVNESSVVLDYGCGIGRIAKGLIEETNCTVIGVDISATMRAFAANYVGSPRFFSLHPDLLWRVYPDIDTVVSVWALQHIPDVEKVLAGISRIAMPGATFFLVNNNSRALPTDNGWMNDGADIDALICEDFQPLTPIQTLSTSAVTQAVARNTFWRVYEKK